MVVNPRMGRVLGWFQDQVEWKLTGRILRWQGDGRWEFTFAEAAREDLGLETMETYIRRRQNMVTQYIATRLLLDF